MYAVENLHNHIDLEHIPFTDRGSRLLVFRRGAALYVRIAERWAHQQGEYGHYRQRAPMLDDLRFADADGQPLDFTADTYPHVITLNTTTGDFDVAFLDAETLVMRLPSGTFTLTFNALCDRGATDRRGGVLFGVRKLAYTTDAQIISNTITPISEHQQRITLTLNADAGCALLFNITPRLGFNRSVPSADAAIDTAKLRWRAWFNGAPPVHDDFRDQYDYAWWIMGAGLLSPRYFFTREAMTPSKIHYVGVWHWDQFFHAIAYRHLDTTLAEDQLRILLDHQQPNGLIPDAIFDEGLVAHLEMPVDADVTKPPLIAWAALKLFEISQRREFLEEVYEPLTRWHQWWVDANRDERGLFVYRHPFSSGLDDSPMWDDGLPVTAPDLNTYLVIQAESLARIAELIDLPFEAARYQAEAARTTQLMLEHMWDDEHGWFHPLAADGAPITVATPFNLLPLWIDGLPDEVYARMIDNVRDPELFWTAYPLATVGVHDPKFDAEQMWRGPAWMNINYLFIEALTRRGAFELAVKLRRDTLRVIMQHSDIYEYYNPITGERPPKSAPIFGWTSAVFIDLALAETAYRFRQRR